MSNYDDRLKYYADSLTQLYKKYDPDNQYKAGDSFDAIKNKMTSDDYDLSQRLLNYYGNANTLKNNLDYNQNLVEQQKNKALQDNAINKEKALLYMPEYLKMKGMSDTGIAQSTYLKANNYYDNNATTINTNANNRINELLDKYNLNQNELYNNYSNEEKSIRDNYKVKTDQEAETLYNEIINNIDGGLYKYIDELQEGYDSIKDKLNDSQRQMLENKIKLYRNDPNQVLADIQYKQENNIDLNEQELSKKQEFDSRQQKLSELGAIGDGISVQNAKESDFGSYYDSGKSGSKQSKMVNRILEMARAGKIENGTFVDFNYGAGWVFKKGSIYVYYDGKFYKTNYTRDDADEIAKEDKVPVLGYNDSGSYSRV